MRTMGIQLPRRQLTISDSMPGNKERVTKYTMQMDTMYDQMRFDTSNRTTKLSANITRAVLHKNNVPLYTSY